MHILRLFIVYVCLIVFANAQSPFPMQYVDEVGHMGWQDRRELADLGLATVYHECEECKANTESDQLRFEGKDDAGRQWRLWIVRVGGFGGTEVWKADFDKNGRQDLLITLILSQSGRCIDEYDMVFVLFDEKGRPAVAKLTTHGFSGFETPPEIVMDVNGDGRREVVASQCKYADHPRFGEDRQIIGIYEARDARWQPLREGDQATYLETAQALIKTYFSQDREDPDYLKWLPMEPDKWPDSLESVGRTGLPRLELADEQ